MGIYRRKVTYARVEPRYPLRNVSHILRVVETYVHDNAA